MSDLVRTLAKNLRVGDRIKLDGSMRRISGIERFANGVSLMVDGEEFPFVIGTNDPVNRAPRRRLAR